MKIIFFEIDSVISNRMYSMILLEFSFYLCPLGNENQYLRQGVTIFGNAQLTELTVSLSIVQTVLQITLLPQNYLIIRAIRLYC